MKKPRRRPLEKMSVSELFEEALRLLKKNDRAIARLNRQVAVLAASLNIHLERVK